MIGRMGDEPHAGSFGLEEIYGGVPTPMRRKRKYRTKKKEYQGWGSTSLIWFLESIGRDTSTEITQSEAANIVMEYVKQHNLFHKTKKKRIECDEKLHLLFGRKTISRLKINDLLESHFAENCEESSDGIFFDSEDDESALTACETPRTAPSERKSQPKKPAFEKPRSCFAAIVPANIKLVYLKRSLVEDLLKDPETFETKVVGSFIRIRCDPNDYLQKNSHQLLQVTGMKKSSEVKGEIHLQASGFIKDIRIQMLSDDNFSVEECEDLHQRVKDCLVKRPMIVDMEQTARVLHEDMTRHVCTELTLDEYLRRREKLQSPDEQERLLREFPQVIADEQKSESTTPDVLDKNVENNLQEFWQATYTKSSSVTEVPNAVANTKLDIADLVKQQRNSPKSMSIPRRAPEVPLLDMTNNSTMLNCISRDTTEHQSRGLSVQLPPLQQTDFAYKNDMSKPANSHEAKISQALPDKQMWSSQIRVIRLSDGLPVQQPPEQQTDFAYNNGTSKPVESQEGKISQALPNKQIRPSQLEVIELCDDLSVQQPPEQQTNFTYKNGMSKPAESQEVKISQALPNKQILQSQLDVIELSDGLPVQQLPEQQINFAYKNDMSKPAELHEVKISQAQSNKQIQPSQIQVIELSDDDDEENEKPSTAKLVPSVQSDTLMWHYRDPMGNVQGPFSLISLKRWSDAGYFPRHFKVWKSGRQVSDDAEKVPQRRRPTISARRQRVATTVVEDVNLVDHGADEVREEPQVPTTDDGGADTKGFPGGPQDTSVLLNYVYHVAASVWTGEERPKLKLVSHGRKVEKFGKPVPEIEGIVAATGLSSLITCSFDTGDRGLLSAFVERWHKETSSFHLPIGDVTITLDDVASLLHLPIVGAFHTFDPLDVDQAVELLVELFEVSTKKAKDKTNQCRGAYVRLAWLRDIYRSKCDARQWTLTARAYLLHLVGCTHFANKSATHINVVFLDAFRDLSQSGSYSWGAAALVHMYENLNDASKHTTKYLVGYITLLQCWIYEHFSTIASTVVDDDYHERKPRACRWKSGKTLPVLTYRKHLDRLTSDAVCWIPYGEHRSSREFELVSLFSGHIRWGSSIVVHQLERPEEPPRHPPVMHDDTFFVPNPPQQVMDAMLEPPAPTTTNVDMPRHAVDACQQIAKNLEHMINMKMVTVGTEACTLIEHCLRLARGVTEQHNVYIQSRRMRDTQDT
ncbi:Uncharacterized protein HKD37_16G046336 [Glycine soja]